MRFAILTASVLLLISGCRDQEQPSVRDAPVSTQAPEGSDNAAEILAALTDPEKLDSLKGKRAATPRLRKSCYWLEAARREGLEPAGLIEAAQRENGSHGTKRAELLKESLLRNRTILERLGCLDEAGMAKLRKGNAPTITKGPYKGELATGDHIIPRSVCPELDNVLINLEFLPETLNQNKGAKVGDRQIQLARKWAKAGVLSKAGLEAVQRATK